MISIPDSSKGLQSLLITQESTATLKKRKIIWKNSKNQFLPGLSVASFSTNNPAEESALELLKEVLKLYH